jgi:hypothetical protein
MLRVTFDLQHEFLQMISFTFSSSVPNLNCGKAGYFTCSVTCTHLSAHSDYVIIIAYPRLQWLRERGSMLESTWNVMAHGDAREGKWRGNWRMEWVASTLHTTSEHGLSSITTADAHDSAASSRLNWRPCRFKRTRPFSRKTKSGFCACHHISNAVYFICSVPLLLLCRLMMLLNVLLLLQILDRVTFWICDDNRPVMYVLATKLFVW